MLIIETAVIEIDKIFNINNSDNKVKIITI